MKFALVGLVVVQSMLCCGSTSVAQENNKVAMPDMSAVAAATSQLTSSARPHAAVHAIVIPVQDQAEPDSVLPMALPTVPIPLTNATSYNMDGAASVMGSNHETMYNMRIKSDQTALSDYLRIAYSFNLADQKFNPTQIVKYVNVGICNPPYFVKNVPAGIQVKYGTKTMNAGSFYSVTTTASSVFTASLTAGDVLSFFLEYQTDDYQFTVLDPYGQKINDESLTQQTGVIMPAIPILASGTYKVLVRPLHDSSLTFTMEFLNANRQNLQSVVNGSSIYSSFIDNQHDYAKYSVVLSKGQYLGLTDPYDSRIRFTLVNSRGAIVRLMNGLPMLYQAPSAGTYYLFIDNLNSWGGSYSGTVTIQ